MHQHLPQDYQQQHQDYSMTQDSAKQNSNMWTPVGHQQHFNVVPGRDLPLTPPADREAVSSTASHAQPYGYMLSGASHGNYAHHQQPSADKSMTPPQEIHHHQVVHQQPTEASPTGSSWWIPSAAAPAPQTDYYHHPHQPMLAHHSTVPSSSSPCQNNVTSPMSSSSPNPSEFQQRVAAALLKTHATLASRRCRRCRCPNCQVDATQFNFPIKR